MVLNMIQEDRELLKPRSFIDEHKKYPSFFLFNLNFNPNKTKLK